MATSPENNPVNLTAAQVPAVLALRNEMRSKIGNDVSTPAVWFGNFICEYVALLCVEAAAGPHQRVAREASALRRQVLLTLGSHLGRKPTADDLVGEIARHVNVPDFLAAVIREDLERFAADPQPPATRKRKKK